MSNKAHLRPAESQAVTQIPEQQQPQQGQLQMQTHMASPVPTVIKAEMPAGGELIVLMISTPQTPMQTIFLDQGTARLIGADLVEMGHRKTISLAAQMPSGLVLPGQS